MDNTPVLPAARPLFRDVCHGKIEHLHEGVVRRENGFGLSYLP